MATDLNTLVLRYECRIYEHQKILSIRSLHVADYPLSNSVQECLETFCDSVGWEFRLRYNIQDYEAGRERGLMSFRCPDNVTPREVIHAIWVSNAEPHQPVGQFSMTGSRIRGVFIDIENCPSFVGNRTFAEIYGGEAQ